MFGKSYNIEIIKAIEKKWNVDSIKSKRINEDNQPQIILKDVTTVYEGEKTPTLFDINLQINKGEFLLITGPNGAGKTTLLETILGILPIKKGTIEIDGMSVLKHGRKLRKKIGYVIQGLDFDPKTPFLVKTAVMIGRSGRIGLFRRIGKEDKRICRYYFDALRNKKEIEDYWNRPIGKLSGGMLQKVMIASALASEPDILLLDEPFSNLDVNARNDIFQLLVKINKLANITILLVSHLSYVPKEISRVILIKKGRIILDAKRTNEVDLEQISIETFC